MAKMKKMIQAIIDFEQAKDQAEAEIAAKNLQGQQALRTMENTKMDLEEALFKLMHRGNTLHSSVDSPSRRAEVNRVCHYHYMVEETWSTEVDTMDPTSEEASALIKEALPEPTRVSPSEDTEQDDTDDTDDMGEPSQERPQSSGSKERQAEKSTVEVADTKLGGTMRKDRGQIESKQDPADRIEERQIQSPPSEAESSHTTPERISPGNMRSLIGLQEVTRSSTTWPPQEAAAQITSLSSSQDRYQLSGVTESPLNAILQEIEALEWKKIKIILGTELEVAKMVVEVSQAHLKHNSVELDLDEAARELSNLDRYIVIDSQEDMSDLSRKLTEATVDYKNAVVRAASEVAFKTGSPRGPELYGARQVKHGRSSSEIAALKLDNNYTTSRKNHSL
ncbi:hypothetical protein CPB97_007629 [Podila verticillata]|nr:hypothetical protein CPB97_007629 [Podila verticillata]